MFHVLQGDFILAPGEEFVQCPYSPAHRITNARMLVHLDKCRQNYKKEMQSLGREVEMVPCRFDYSHQVPAPELPFHESRCTGRNNVISHMQYHASEDFKRKMSDRQQEEEEEAAKAKLKRKKLKREAKLNKLPIKEEGEAEDWDHETKGYECGYDPNEYLEKDIFLVQPRGMTPAERKAYRLKQREKADGIYDDKKDIKLCKSDIQVKDEGKLKMEPEEMKDDKTKVKVMKNEADAEKPSLKSSRRSSAMSASSSSSMSNKSKHLVTIKTEPKQDEHKPPQNVQDDNDDDNEFDPYKC